MHFCKQEKAFGITMSHSTLARLGILMEAQPFKAERSPTIETLTRLGLASVEVGAVDFIAACRAFKACDGREDFVIYQPTQEEIRLLAQFHRDLDATVIDEMYVSKQLLLQEIRQIGSAGHLAGLLPVIGEREQRRVS